MRTILLVTCAAGIAAGAWADATSCTHFADEIVLHIGDLDLLRAGGDDLSAEIALTSEAGEDRYTVDLQAPCQSPAIVLRKRPGARYSGAVCVIRMGGDVLRTDEFPLGEPVAPRADLPLSGTVAATEPGNAGVMPPAVELPDMAALRTVPLPTAERRLDVDRIVARVETDVNYPLVSANNNCAVSLQTAHPEDPNRRSVYVPMKSQLFDPATGMLAEVAHYLVEVPLDEAWLQGEGDLEVALPTDAIRVHTADATWPAQGGTPILGNGAGGLGQLVATVAVDEQGRIYYSAVPSGVVRFDPRTARFEVPPIAVDAHFAQYLPPAEQIPEALKRGETQVRWEGYKIIAVSRGRLFYAPIITAVYAREEYTAFNFAGLLSMPVDHWDDPAAFAAATRFHAGSWPGAEHSFFEGWTDPNDRTRKLGRLFPRDDGLYITAYLKDWGGPWRLQFDDEGTTLSFGRVDEVTPAPTPARRDSASGLADWRSYGSLTMTRAALDALLHGAAGAQPDGTIALRYDAVAAMRRDPARYGELLAATSGPSLAPAYMATAIPGQPDTVLGVGEYGYYLATFDLSRADEGVITKRYLLRDLGASELELPLEVGLGPYGFTWWREAEALYLYLGGYTGLTRLVYQRPELQPGRQRMEDFTFSIREQLLDDAGAGPIKRFRYLQPGLDGRIFLTGTHEAARAGTAYSGGLMSFTADGRDVLDKLSAMSRCYWTTGLESRVVLAPDAPATQQFFLTGGSFDENYAFMLDPALVPANHDPKLFAYDYAAGGQPRALFGIAMPPATETGTYLEQRFDRTRHYLVMLHGASLLSYDVAAHRFVDGLTLTADGPLRIVEFERPDWHLLRTPDDRLVMYCAAGESPTEATFVEVTVAPDGTLSVAPLVTLTAATPEGLARTLGEVCCFVPDLTRGDGSCDLLLGVPWRTPGADARLIRDLIPPRR